MKYLIRWHFDSIVRRVHIVSTEFKIFHHSIILILIYLASIIIVADYYLSKAVRIKIAFNGLLLSERCRMACNKSISWNVQRIERSIFFLRSSTSSFPLSRRTSVLTEKVVPNEESKMERKRFRISFPASNKFDGSKGRV